ncbi:phosphopentomutase [Anaerosporomusa subterranea]|uniref:Phosphopentomutase n=1 Tax=Anaerosporomusa subterranea TaxID=1794912 RepID=A0A154BU89_ANASB|nr:phosphopentomutase [Anaerosporomusa subterranea]KYZ77499.1 phosphopentomutase [Anaerosporomusa subterranea]
MFERIIIIVLDSVGIGALPDAAEYGDAGANTLGHIATARGGLKLPTLASLGLGCIAPIAGVPCPEQPLACYGKLAESSKGKDTTTGHWEMAGAPVSHPFPYYPNGFPAEIMDKFAVLTGRTALGNKVASGTEIIAELGEEHMKTGKPIVYTSADSVFQIAAHEDIIPLTKLYAMCRIARDQILVGEHAVGRIIARPFIGIPGAFTRTPNRHDYSLMPDGETMLDRVKAAGLPCIGIGKIGDIFAQRGLTESFPTKSNQHGMDILETVLSQIERGLIMANLVEFDSSFGHRRDIDGYAAALEAFDSRLAGFLPKLGTNDLLIITADHGCDPTAQGTDHTREYVPLLAYQVGTGGQSLGIRTTFADIAASVLDIFSLPPLPYGSSFLQKK